MDRMFAKKSVPLSKSETACTGWALLLPDAAEGSLNELESTALGQHLATCRKCAEELAEAQRGLAWLDILRQQTPEPPADLLSSILARTSESPAERQRFPVMVPSPAPGVALLQPAGEVGQWTAKLRSWLGVQGSPWAAVLEPRLAMTAAMAFLSICITLNLTGLSLRSVPADALTGGGLHRMAAQTGAYLLRTIQGNRIVYRVQSRVEEIRAGGGSASTELRYR